MSFLFSQVELSDASSTALKITAIPSIEVGLWVTSTACWRHVVIGYGVVSDPCLLPGAWMGYYLITSKRKPGITDMVHCSIFLNKGSSRCFLDTARLSVPTYIGH